VKKKILIAALAGAVCLGTIHLVPVIADGNSTNHSEEKSSTSKSDLRGDRDLNLDNERIKSLAEEYGVSLEGKDLETVQTELRDALMNAKADELGISTDGKSLDELELELKAASGKDFETTEEEGNVSDDTNDYRMNLGNRADLLKNKAKEFGIETDDKDSEAIQQEVLERMMNEKAAELGISTDGKDFDTLKEELKEALDNDR
jgi:predicted RNase H-like HicB family nuclease